ncbi:MAG: phosphatidylserine/phosphatidylglycerophosphate/cardiolipin synthase family protein [Myxococcales bacterium]|nr:phosphatidylserine/phosphatidylglycerophosphate/cardiolipin synthase family protein [Myxococcales bacterium]MCB9544513.1 phosphatidylserine/phosphatidylglycerophosphate/cardiolipin synthase family protein [Myxococcales bacterium]
MKRSREVADQGMTLQVTLADRADAAPNRLVIYDWFTRVGSPPRAGNDVEVLVDGEETWARVFQDLEVAEDRVQVATWLMRADLEMVRPEALATAEPAERASLRFAELAERLAERGVKVRLLIWGGTYTPLLNRWLRRWFWKAPFGIELLEQDHPRLIGSYHQKTFTIDSRVGYCGGMNVKENDWDSPAHRVFEPRRNPHKTGAAFRRAVQARQQRTKFPPRHDLSMRIEGPAVHDLEVNFQQRWNQSLRHQRASLVGRLANLIRNTLLRRPAHTLMAEPEPRQPEQGDRWVQIVRTTPGGEEGILDAYKRAIANARKYIYIENQYFRSPIIGEAIARALDRNPRLRLAVVAWPVADGEVSRDPSGYWTAHTHRLIAEKLPDFKLTRLMIHDADAAKAADRYLQVDVHAKVMVIDDRWLTIGSANINDRGFKFEAEINSVLLDEDDARALRLRLMAEHLEVPDAEIEEKLGDIDQAFDLWEQHGAENARRKAAGEGPISRVVHFVQKAPPKPPFNIGQGVF